MKQIPCTQTIISKYSDVLDIKVETDHGAAVYLNQNLLSNIRRIGQHIERILVEIINQHGADAVTANQLYATHADEVERVYNIADQMLHLSFPWDDYLPFTKKGTLPKNKSILVADTTIRSAFANPYRKGMFGNGTWQLRLVPVSELTQNWQGGYLENAVGLVFQEFSVKGTVPPIFDANNIPARRYPAKNT